MTIFVVLSCLMYVVSTAPVPQKMVDMTYTFDESTLFYPNMKPFQLKTIRNGTADDDIWIQVDEISSGVHVGTHMDAPSHFTKGGISIDQIPVERLIAPAAVVDITSKAALNRDYEITVDDLLKWEKITGHSLNGKILLLRSGWGKKWGDRADFFGTSTNDPAQLHSPGLAADTARWIVDSRPEIVGIGVETLTFDTGRSRTMDAHQILLGHGLFAIENMANMDKLPIYGATLTVLPMKLGKSSGAPTRILATFPEVIFDQFSSESCSAQ